MAPSFPSYEIRYPQQPQGQHVAEQPGQSHGSVIWSSVKIVVQIVAVHTITHKPRWSAPTHPHSENPQTWHFTHPSANSSCDPQSGHVPMNDWV